MAQPPHNQKTFRFSNVLGVTTSSLNLLAAGKGVAHCRRNAQGLAGDRDQHHDDFKFKHQHTRDTDLLRQGCAGSANFFDTRIDLQNIIHPRGPQKVAMHAPDDKGGRFKARRAIDHAPAVGPEKAKKIGASALAPADVTGVIGNAASIGIFEINAHRKHMATAMLIVDDPAGQIRPARVFRYHASLPPNVIATISGGDPKRTGKTLQPSPPDTIKLRPSSTMCP